MNKKAQRFQMKVAKEAKVPVAVVRKVFAAWVVVDNAEYLREQERFWKKKR